MQLKSIMDVSKLYTNVLLIIDNKFHALVTGNPVVEYDTLIKLTNPYKQGAVGFFIKPIKIEVSDKPGSYRESVALIRFFQKDPVGTKTSTGIYFKPENLEELNENWIEAVGKYGTDPVWKLNTSLLEEFELAEVRKLETLLIAHYAELSSKNIAIH